MPKKMIRFQATFTLAVLDALETDDEIDFEGALMSALHKEHLTTETHLDTLEQESYAVLDAMEQEDADLDAMEQEALAVLGAR